MADLTSAAVVHLVPLRRRHLKAVLRIEGQVYPQPWTFSLYMSELRQRSSRHYVAAKVDGAVVGYGGIMHSLGEAHVTTIAVDPGWRRHRIGTRILINLTRAAIASGARHMTLEVRVSNTSAQKMYRRFGYETEGVRKGYYADSNEDALIMWARHIHTDDYADRLHGLEAALRPSTVDETGVTA